MNLILLIFLDFFFNMKKHFSTLIFELLNPFSVFTPFSFFQKGGKTQNKGNIENGRLHEDYLIPFVLF